MTDRTVTLTLTEAQALVIYAICSTSRAPGGPTHAAIVKRALDQLPRTEGDPQ